MKEITFSNRYVSLAQWKELIRVLKDNGHNDDDANAIAEAICDATDLDMSLLSDEGMMDE